MPTDEQLAAFRWWCESTPGESGLRPEDRAACFIMHWREYVTGFSEASDAQHLDLLQFIEKPSLEFVRQVVGVLKASEAAPPPN